MQFNPALRFCMSSTLVVNTLILSFKNIKKRKELSYITLLPLYQKKQLSQFNWMGKIMLGSAGLLVPESQEGNQDFHKKNLKVRVGSCPASLQKRGKYGMFDNFTPKKISNWISLIKKDHLWQK